MKPKKAVEEFTGVMCDGVSRAWGAKFKGEPHEAQGPHPDCKNCGAKLGCRLCSGIAQELLCMNCKDWGHVDALREHGSLLKEEERTEGIAFLRSLSKAR